MWCKKIIPILCCLLIVPSLSGQVQDTLAVLQLLEQAEKTGSTTLAKEKYEVAYTLSNTLNYDVGRLAALPKLAAIEIEQDNLAAGLRYLIEELDILNRYQQPERVIDINIQIGDLYRQELLFEEGLVYYRNAERLTATTNKTNWAILYDKLGYAYTQLLLPDSAAIFYLKLMAPTNTEELVQLKTLRKLVTAYQKAGRYETALNYNLQMKSLMEASSKWQSELGVLYNNLGYTSNYLEKNKQAIKWFLKAASFFENDNDQLSVIYSNLGIAHFNAGDAKLAIYYLLKALSLLDATDYTSKGNINNLLSNIYLQSDDFFNAQNHNRAATRFAELSDKTALKSDVYATAANIHSQLHEYEEAIAAFKTHLELRDSLALIRQLEQQRLLEEKISLGETEKEIKLLLIRDQMNTITIERLELEKASQQLAIDNLTLQSQQTEKDLEILKQLEVIRQAEMKNQALETERTRQLLKLAEGKIERQSQQRQLSELANSQAMAQAELEAKEAQLIQEEQRNSILEREKEIDHLELESQQKTLVATTRIGLLLLLISLMVLMGLLYSRRINKKLAQQKIEIEAEQQKSENLLLNILPVSVAEELKEKGRAIPRRYESVSILFSDFVDFTRISSNTTPEQIIQELNDCFMGFDAIMEAEGIEKIQTIGDGYLAVGGLPEETPDHAIKCIRAGKKMIAFLKERNKDHDIQWNARIGIHSGPITAGVVGTKKFAYNIFGDTVNTASRIETAGQSGRINISANTYLLVKDHFECEYRGKIKAKGKGELDMYFVK